MMTWLSIIAIILLVAIFMIILKIEDWGRHIGTKHAEVSDRMTAIENRLSDDEGETNSLSLRLSDVEVRLIDIDTKLDRVSDDLFSLQAVVQSESESKSKKEKPKRKKKSKK